MQINELKITSRRLGLLVKMNILTVEDLLKYSQVLYSRYDKYSERLIKIAKKDI